MPVQIGHAVPWKVLDWGEVSCQSLNLQIDANVTVNVRKRQRFEVQQLPELSYSPSGPKFRGCLSMVCTGISRINLECGTQN
jgi:hypothetical protein